MSKTKIIIILLIIVIVWSSIFFLILYSKNKAQKKREPLEKILEDAPLTEYTPPSEEDLVSIGEIYEKLPKPLSKFIPENSTYSIEYSYEIPAFVVTLDAKNEKGFKKAMKDSFNFFYQFELNPCESPLFHGVLWTVEDWSVLDGELTLDFQQEICEKVKIGF